MQELHNKIELIFKAKFPTESIRNEILEKSGEIIILETLEKVLGQLPGDTEREFLANLMRDGKIEESFDYAKKFGVLMEDIFEEVSKSVVTDLFS